MNVAFDFTKIIMTFGSPSQQEKGEKLPFLTKQSLSLLEIIEVNFPQNININTLKI